MAIGHAVVYFARAAMHLVQELNVGIVGRIGSIWSKSNLA